MQKRSVESAKECNKQATKVTAQIVNYLLCNSKVDKNAKVARYKMGDMRRYVVGSAKLANEALRRLLATSKCVGLLAKKA